MEDKRKQGENERRTKALLGSVKRLAARHTEFLELCESEQSFKDLEDIIIGNIKLLSMNLEIEAMRALIKEGKAKAVAPHLHIIDGEKA